MQNHGFSSIGSLSESLGSQRFGTCYRFRNADPACSTATSCPIDLAANAESLGAEVIRVKTIDEFRDAARARTRGDPHHRRDPHRDRPARPGAVVGELVGRPRLPRSRSSTAPARRRKTYEGHKAASARYLTPSTDERTVQ